MLHEGISGDAISPSDEGNLFTKRGHGLRLEQDFGSTKAISQEAICPLERLHAINAANFGFKNIYTQG